MSRHQPERDPEAPDLDRIGKVIRLESDYMCGVPLWGESGCLNGPRTDLGLSSQLYADLVTWQQDFDHHFDHRDGWDTPSSATEYAAAGRHLLKRLRSELPRFEITLDLWPVPQRLRHTR